MFTGIVEEIGEVVSVVRLGDSALLRLRGPLVASDASPGDSISVNGVCLTVVQPPSEADDSGQPAPGEGEFTADVMAETLLRSNLGELSPGDPVDLERAVPAHGRLGGHIVQGHVDGTGTVLDVRPGDAGADGRPRWQDLTVSLPPRLARYVAEKGSIAVDGVSLTVVRVEDGGPSFTVSLIPTTLDATVLGTKRPGATVNLEVDVVAKYVERLTGAITGTTATTGMTDPAGHSPAVPTEAVR